MDQEGGSGGAGNRLTAVTRLEMMVAWAAVAAVKAMKSGRITDRLWRESRGPGCRVNRQTNRRFHRKQTNAQDQPPITALHRPPLCLTPTQLSQRGASAGRPCQLTLFLNGCGCAQSSGKLLLLHPSLHAAVSLPGKLSLCVQPSGYLGSSALFGEQLFLAS